MFRSERVPHSIESRLDLDDIDKKKQKYYLNQFKLINYNQ